MILLLVPRAGEIAVKEVQRLAVTGSVEVPQPADESVHEDLGVHTQPSFIESSQYRQATCFVELVPNAPSWI